jgi:Zn-dependent protease
VFPSIGVIIERLLVFLPVLVLSLTVHEFAHAWAARRLGDDTAERMGRYTLNPLAHMDPIGTFFLPVFTNIPFGWAKPVPVNPARFRRDVRMGKGMMITALAGPASNVLLAVISAIALGLICKFEPAIQITTSGPMLISSEASRLQGSFPLMATIFFYLAIQLNVVLAAFNMLPIPPLDGSRIVDAFLPLRFRKGWETFSRFSIFILLAIVFLGWRIIDGPVNAAIGALVHLVNVIA